MERILVATDCSERSRAGPPQRYDFETTIDADTLARQHEEVLAREIIRSAGPTVSSFVVKGERPAKQILDFARARGADLIACGTRGRGSRGPFVMGSVAAGFGTRCDLLRTRDAGA
jgi:nucleotide-binding universal stress UspA family protein